MEREEGLYVSRCFEELVESFFRGEDEECIEEGKVGIEVSGLRVTNGCWLRKIV